MLELYPWQQSQWQQQLAAIRSVKVPHALLLTGPQGIGLDHYAACLALRLLCEHPPSEGVGCGQCRSCTLFQAGNHPDYRVVEPEWDEKKKKLKERTGINVIRELIDYVYISSHSDRYKIILFPTIYPITSAALNTLLKTLEEPSPDCILILASHKPDLLPITIRSRCQRVNFPAVYDETAINWLDKMLGEQGTESTMELLFMAQGGPVRALELFESESVAQQQRILHDLRDISLDRADPIQIAKRWDGIGAAMVLQWLMMFITRMTRIKMEAQDKNPDNPSVILYLQDLAKPLDLRQLVACYDLALQNYHAATGPVALNKQGLLEDVIIYWQALNTQSEDNIR